MTPNIDIAKSNKLTPGTTYKVHHSSGLINWRFDRMVENEGYGSRRKTKSYYGVNTRTGRTIVLKSIAKIRGEIGLNVTGK